MSITYDYIDDYLYRIAAPRDRLLEKMEEYADSHAVPIIGPLVGRLLYNLAKTSQSRKILEIGTAIGYSGIWLARAVAPLKGNVTTIDMDPERVKIAKKNISEAGLERVVKVIEGNALKVLPTLKEEFDMIFLDSDKDVYPDAYTQSMIKFNRLVSESAGMSTVIVPLRDGVLVSLKE